MILASAWCHDSTQCCPGLAAKHKTEILQHHLPGLQGGSVGYDHRMYCKVTTEAEAAKQRRACQRYAETADAEDKDEDREEEEEEELEDGDSGSEYETDSGSSSSRDVPRRSRSCEREKTGGDPHDILGRYVTIMSSIKHDERFSYLVENLVMSLSLTQHILYTKIIFNILYEASLASMTMYDSNSLNDINRYVISTLLNRTYIKVS